MERHRFVGIILVSSGGNVLLQLRRDDESYYPGYWTLPGGKVGKDESIEDALKREVKEELDLNLHDYTLFKKIVEKRENDIIKRYIYWSNINKKIEDLKLGEGSALRFFCREEIPPLKIAFALKPIIEEFMESTCKIVDSFNQ